MCLFNIINGNNILIPVINFIIVCIRTQNTFNLTSPSKWRMNRRGFFCAVDWVA